MYIETMRANTKKCKYKRKSVKLRTKNVNHRPSVSNLLVQHKTNCKSRVIVYLQYPGGRMFPHHRTGCTLHRSSCQHCDVTCEESPLCSDPRCGSGGSESSPSGRPDPREPSKLPWVQTLSTQHVKIIKRIIF